MENSIIRKPLSILLSVLMLLSVIGGLTVAGGAERNLIEADKVYHVEEQIDLPEGTTTYIKWGRYGDTTAATWPYIMLILEYQENTHYTFYIDGGYGGAFAQLDASDRNEVYGGYNDGDVFVGFVFVGSGTQGDPYVLKLKFGEKESTWAGEGEGTEASPWLINDINDLRTLAANVKGGMRYSGKYLKLMNDIDCGNGNWEPIGGYGFNYEGVEFNGTFDGNGKKITYKSSETGYPTGLGLFYAVGQSGTVKNLNVDATISCSTTSFVGGIASRNNGTITNCYCNADITSGSDFSSAIAGYGSNDGGAVISYCVASGTLTWTASGIGAYTAGILPQVYDDNVLNCVSLCNVYAPNADEYSAAGLVIGRYIRGRVENNYYLDTAETTGVVNTIKAEAKTADELKEIGQAAYDAGYTVYGLALGGVDHAPDDVAALIDDIGEVEYTDESKEKIVAARTAYEALTDDQKALVENYETLTAAETAYDELKAAAETPDEPEEPAGDRICSYCGEVHNGGIVDLLIAYIHTFISIFRNLFPALAS